MVELVALLCLIDHPETCIRSSQVYAGESVTISQCQAGAQAQLAQWIVMRGDKWAVRNYGCRRAGQFAKA